jgi:copper chaperone CopZ
MKEIVLGITGMTCGSCARTAERVLAGTPGVEEARVDLGRGIAIVKGSVAPSSLIDAVTAAGYGASVADVTKAQEGSES